MAGSAKGHKAEASAGTGKGDEHREHRPGPAVQAAKTIAGMWKEFNEDEPDPPPERGTTSGDDAVVAAAAAGAPHAGAAEKAPSEAVARIVAYSDSDSDEPLPFQVQQRKHTKRTLDPVADVESAQPAAAQAAAVRRRWWRWQGSGGSAEAAAVLMQACPPC